MWRPVVLLLLGLLWRPSPVQAVICRLCTALPHCTVCDVSLNPAGGDHIVNTCYQCQDARFLHMGACHDSCAPFACPGTTIYPPEQQVCILNTTYKRQISADRIEFELFPRPVAY